MGSSFAEALCALMAERDISGRGLARRVPCDSALICRYRSGKQMPSLKMAHRLDEVLDAGGDLVTLADVGRRTVLAGGAAAGLAALAPGSLERLAWARRHPRRIDQAAVDSLAAVLATQRRVEDALGSAAVLGPVVAQLAAVEELVAEARGPVRPEVISIAMQWAQFTAYLHRDAGDAAADRVRSAQTLEWATEIGDRTMIATVLVNRGGSALLAGEVGSAIGLAQAAQRDKTATVGQRAYGADLEARGHVITGDRGAAERKLGEVQDLAAALEDRPQDRRPWSYWLTPTWFRCQRGITLGWLAHESRYYDLAVTELESGYSAMPENERLSAWAALFLVHLAAVHMRGGDAAQACVHGLRAAPIAQQTGSVRLAGMLAQLHADLQARHPDDPRVAELADALA